jgi:hypothetical protein
LPAACDFENRVKMGIRDDRNPMDRAIALQKLQAPAEGAASLARRRHV